MNDQALDHLIDRALADEGTLPEGISERLEARLQAYADSQTQTPLRLTSAKPRRRLYLASGIAASLLLAAALFFETQNREPQPRDTFTDPARAALVAHDALTLLSSKLNKGLSPVRGADAELQHVNQLLTSKLEILQNNKKQ
ncbi:MAG: hypothetical protein LBM06_07800 [Prevotellaceae bacterium]|jgi:hypothetical protein|nr:hypothetical protein [Prevotellaceae bacterium]MDR0989345.1 hypothetical protein [Prevotellaceae bacterium]